MKVRKAVITAAGLGTRALPATKSVPKEMIFVVDKPAIQYIVEECAAAGITDILIIISRGKQVIEDHFDRSPELEAKLEQTGKTELLEQIKRISDMAHITFVRQHFQTGLGAAVLCAERFACGEPVAVLYGDDVIIGDDPAIGQLARAYEKYGKSVVGIREVSAEDIVKYNSMKIGSALEDGIYPISDMIEKPKRGEEFSMYSILGRCILEPQIFDILHRIPFGINNELQLTDAMREIALKDGMIGVDFTGNRYDMGSKIGIIKATIEVALSRDDLKDELSVYLKEIAKTIGS